jgi:hypothetical protein
LREDTQRLEEEKAALEGMVESSDELLMEIARQTRLDRMEEDDEDEEDVDDGGDAVAPPTAMLPAPVPPATAPKEIDTEGPMEMIPDEEALVPHEVILANAEPEIPQLLLHHPLMRDYEESQPRMMDDLDELDDDPNEDRFDMDEWFPKDGSNDRD